MPRENIKSKDEQIQESQRLLGFFTAAQSIAKQRGDNLTQLSLSLEMDVTQGMIQKWLNGKSPIATDRLLWLAKRLNFDPKAVRPSLSQLDIDNTYTEEENRTLELYRTDPDFRRIVDAIAQTSPFFRNATQTTDESNTASPKKVIAKKK